MRRPGQSRGPTGLAAAKAKAQARGQPDEDRQGARRRAARLCGLFGQRLDRVLQLPLHFHFAIRLRGLLRAGDRAMSASSVSPGGSGLWLRPAGAQRPSPGRSSARWRGPWRPTSPERSWHHSGSGGSRWQERNDPAPRRVVVASCARRLAGGITRPQPCPCGCGELL
jgi:hypothetical protein